MSIKTRVALVAGVAVTASFALTACLPAGTVVDRGRICTGADPDHPVDCNQGLTVRGKDGSRVYSDVDAKTYRKCQVGDRYPDCAQ